MLKRWLFLCLLPLTLAATNEWQEIDLTDGFGHGALISGDIETPPPAATGGPSPIRVGAGTFTTDTSTFDVTWSGAGTPTGVVVFASYATADNTNTAHAAMSCGVSDFTTTAAVSMFMEDNVATTDSRRAHQETSVVYLMDNTTTPVRTATVAAITDGVRFTPGESGTAYKISVVGIFDGSTKAFSAGAGTTTGNTFSVTHGLGVAPKAGIYCYNGLHQTNNIHGTMSVGLSQGTTQRTLGWRWQDGQTDGVGHMRVITDSVAALVNNSGGTFHTVELTANNFTQTDFTARGANTDGDLIGILLPLTAFDAALVTQDSPNATGAWSVMSQGFTAASAIVLANQSTAVDSAISDSPLAGTVGVFATDMASEISVSITDENAAGPSNTSSRQSTELWLGDDDQTEDYACNTFAGITGGFSATCDTASATTNKWLALYVSGSATTNDMILRRRR